MKVFICSLVVLAGFVGSAQAVTFSELPEVSIAVQQAAKAIEIESDKIKSFAISEKDSGYEVKLSTVRSMPEELRKGLQEQSGKEVSGAMDCEVTVQLDSKLMFTGDVYSDTCN